MVIFTSYVKLPEGLLEATSVFQDYKGERRRLDRVSHCLSLILLLLHQDKHEDNNYIYNNFTNTRYPQGIMALHWICRSCRYHAGFVATGFQFQAPFTRLSPDIYIYI